MILEIVTYGHPSLRTKGRKIAKIDDRTRRLAADMTETMHHARGVGLAAQQVGVPLQLFVLNVLQDEKRPSRMLLEGKSVPFDYLMPLVLINPEIETDEEIVSEEEGCLSFPDIYGEVARPFRVHLRAQNLEGGQIEFHADGLLARAVQHEFDHLQGVLFTDRMAPEILEELKPDIEALKGRER